MSSPLSFTASVLVSIVNGHIDKCPTTQTADSYAICNIFRSTNIEEIIPQNFTDLNYCTWNYQDSFIGCESDDDDEIELIEIQYADGLNGTLNFKHSWPHQLKELDLEQSCMYKPFLHTSHSIVYYT